MSQPADDAGAARRLAASREHIDRWLAGDVRQHAQHPPVAGSPPAAGLHAPPAGSPAPGAAPSAPPPVPPVPPVLLGVLDLLVRRWLGLAGGVARADPLPLGLAVAQASLSPLARTHPWALMALAAAGGAVLARAGSRRLRPLQWLGPMLAPVLAPLVLAALSRWRPPPTPAQAPTRTTPP